MGSSPDIQYDDQGKAYSTRPGGPARRPELDRPPPPAPVPDLTDDMVDRAAKMTRSKLLGSSTIDSTFLTGPLPEGPMSAKTPRSSK
jgi:hypothetical protein